MGLVLITIETSMNAQSTAATYSWCDFIKSDSFVHRIYKLTCTKIKTISFYRQLNIVYYVK